MLTARFPLFHKAWKAALLGGVIGLALAKGYLWLREVTRPTVADELDKIPAYRDMVAQAWDECVGSCQFDRTSPQTVLMHGHIRPETYDAFMNALDERVTDVVVNMIGGDVETALKMAEEIERRKLRVVVQGYCLSSCANYLFMAGHEKRLLGILAFHGGVQALHRDLVRSGKNPPCRPCAMEKAFFARLGISEKLFDVTQSRNKGYSTPVAMYAPSAATLRALGVRHIAGDQDTVLLRQSDILFETTGERFFQFARDPNPAFTDTHPLSK